MIPGLANWLRQIESRHPTEIELGLDRVASVAAQAKILNFRQPVITVAGTNGKGSTIAAMETLFSAMGYTVASFTSPHLVHYNERVRINGKPVNDLLLLESFDEVEEHRLAAGDIPLTYFETSLLSALWVFKLEKPDVVLLEVGLGGRLDAVNIVDPDVAIITSIALDHQDWLGSDVECIGREKAGILRNQIPIILGQNPMPNSVIESAIDHCCDVYTWQQAFDFNETERTFSWKQAGGSQQELALESSPKLPIPSIACALQAIQILLEQKHLPRRVLSREEASRVLNIAQLAGRFSTDFRFPKVVFDVAHNPHAAAHLADKVKQWQQGRVIAVVGMLNDKDARGVAKALANEVDRWIVADLSHQHRGLSAVALAEQIKDCIDGEVIIAGKPTEALQSAQVLCNQDDHILVFGSFLTVGEILAKG